MRIQCKLRRDVLRSVEHCERGKRSCCYLVLHEKETLFVSHDYTQMLVVKWPSKARKSQHTFYIETDSVRYALRALQGDHLLFNSSGLTARLGDGKKSYPLKLTEGFLDYSTVLAKERPVRDEHEICPDRAVRMLGAIDRLRCEWINVASSQEAEPLTMTGELPVKGYTVTGLLMPKLPDGQVTPVDWHGKAKEGAKSYDLAHLLAGDNSCHSLDILLNLCSPTQIQSFVKLLEIPHEDAQH